MALVCAFLLGSCGGGGATQVNTLPPGPDNFPFAVQPASATWYAGITNTLTLVGSSGPFTLSSSEPGILAVPQTVTGRSVDLVPLQPGVVDSGLAAGELQVRTVILTARSVDGQTATATIKVAQNFLTGYGMFFTNTPSTCSGTSPCAGGETTIIFDSTFNGAVYAGHQFRITRIRGPFQFIDPLNSNNQTDSVTVTSDHEGKFTTVIRVATGVPTQVAILQVTDLATGATTIRPFTISGTPATGALTLLPDAVTLTGPTNQCGLGLVDVLVFDGVGPYTATCPNPVIQVVGSSSTPTGGGRVTFNVGASNFCLNAEPCVIQDGTGSRATVTFTTVKGPAPTTTPIVVSPNDITLICNSTGAVSVAGGQGNYSVNSSHPRVFASVSGSSVTITRVNGDGPPGPNTTYPNTATVSVTDGFTIANITVHVPPNCP